MKKSLKMEIYLGNKDTCEFSLSSKKYKWLSTKNWMDTNCKNQKIVKTLNEKECDILNLIFQSLWPIYNAKNVKETDVLSILKVALKCEIMEQYFEYLLTNIDFDYICYLLESENESVQEFLEILDYGKKKSNSVMKTLDKIIKQYYVNYIVDQKTLENFYLYDKIDESKFSEETKIKIIQRLKEVVIHWNFHRS